MTVDRRFSLPGEYFDVSRILENVEMRIKGDLAVFTWD